MSDSKQAVAKKQEEPASADKAPKAAGDAGKSAGTPAPAPAATTGKRAPGTKEVIPFRWKLVGESPDAVLTLFKAVEVGEVEAQLERTRKDGYYKNLRVLDIDAQIRQPVSAKTRQGARKSPKTAAATKAKKAQKVVSPPAKPKRAERTKPAARPSSSPKARKTRKVKATAKTPKTAKKKVAASKSTRKRTAKKK